MGLSVRCDACLLVVMVWCVSPAYWNSHAHCNRHRSPKSPSSANPVSVVPTYLLARASSIILSIPRPRCLNDESCVAGLADMYFRDGFLRETHHCRIHSCDTFVFCQCVNTCADVEKEWQLQQIKAKVICLLLPNCYVAALAFISPLENASLSVYAARAGSPRRDGKRRREATWRHK